MAFSLLPNFLCFLSLLPFLVLAQNKTNIISLGHSFSASDNSTPWVVSPSGDFAFGFRAVGDVFYLSIWYAKIPDPDKTIVWYANRDNPAPKGSKVQVTADSGLLLTSPDGEELWKPETLIGTVSDAVLNDSGNFILRDANSGRVWETFKNPRDTILPSQVLEKGGRLNSRLSEGNFSKGRFELLLDQDGNLVFHSINLPSEYVNENYYESKTVGSNTSSPGHQLVFNKSGSVYILRENNEIFNISSGGGVSSSDYYLRATMDSDGVFTLYKHPKSSSGSESWTAVWSQPDNICTASLVSAGIGVCGYNSICTLSADRRPICKCLRDYSPLDPTDPHGSCKADFKQGCEEDSLSPGKNLYEFVEYTDTDWPLSDSVLQKPFTEDECKQACMEDCLCAVAIFRLGDSCWKKKLPLSNGRVDSSLTGGKAFIKVRKRNVSLGHSFSASDNSTPWVVSPSGDFAFGFRAVGDVFYLSIWYAQIPDKTIVWYANRDNPAPNGSKVQVTADSGLLLTSPDGEELWKPETLIGTVSDGVLNDSGNFILRDANSGSVWETFKNPRDTILPSQVLEKGVRLNSRLSEGNFSKGRFELLLQQDGNLVLHSINLPSGYANENYYESDTVLSSPGHQLVFNKSGSVYILTENNEIFNIYSAKEVSSQDNYLRATMDSDGVFSLYRHPKSSSGSEGWTAVWSQPDNICTASQVTAGIGVCGYNSICTLSAGKRPDCKCLRDYSPLDPSDPHGSCKADFIQGCEEDSLSPGKDLYEFAVLTDTDWPLSDSVLQKPFTEEKCKQSCMEDCLCAVAIFRLGDSCGKKKLPLSNGRVDSSLNGAKAFIKVRKGNVSLSGSGPPIIIKKNQNTLILVLSVLLGGSGCLNLILILAICLSFSLIYKHYKKLKKINRIANTVETNLRCFSYKELEEATNGFKEELGRGSFGIVYKGDLGLGSKCLVAVKKLHTYLLQDIEREFRNEVKIIGQTHHKNLVRLLGFCEDGAERLLVYEYMSNGTLANLLFNETNSKPSWNVRLRIAFGIARGLLYLHEECSTQIIHCDIKPQNILLDDYYNARISDFGLAKLLNMNQSRTDTAIRGTKGYVALEWFKNRPITAKVDVYSFGVLLLEIICCRKNVNVESDNEELAILTDWAYDCYKEGNLGALFENDKEALSDRKNLEKLVMIAIWCTQDDPVNRPTMRKVTQMLEGVVEVPDPPCPYQSSVTGDPFLSFNVSGSDQF